jgi:tRNA wybutosine-synthesizing protein 1
VYILYGSQGGTAKAFAEQLAVACASAAGLPAVSCLDMKSLDPEAFISDGVPTNTAVLVVLSTYEGGTAPEPARFFCRSVLLSLSLSLSILRDLHELHACQIEIA